MLGRQAFPFWEDLFSGATVDSSEILHQLIYSKNIPLSAMVLYMSAGFLARFQPQSTGHVKTSRVFFHEKKIQTKPTAAAPNQRRLFPNPDLSLPEIVQGLGSVGAFHEIR